MKLLSVLLMACIVFLSAFAGIKKPMEAITKADCCKHTQDKTACRQNPKPTGDDDCTKPACNMLFTCTMCGFLIVEPLTIKPGFTSLIPKLIPLYKIGDLSAYHTSSWKPPQNV